MSIDDRLHEAAARLRVALSSLPVEEPPEAAPSRGRRIVLVAATGVVVLGLTAAVLARRDADTAPPVGPPTTGSQLDAKVPEIVGLTLEAARSRLTEAGLAFVVELGDPAFAKAVVIAAEPGDGTEVPSGAVVGLRTALPDPPVSAECPSGRHPRGDVDADALPQVGQVARAGAEATVGSLRAEGAEVYLGVWDRWAYEERDGSVITEPTEGFQAIVVTPSGSVCPAAPTFQLAPVTFVTGDITVWAGDRLEPGSPRQELESLAAGPLGPRGGHSVLWTGEEVIVWGGWGDETGNQKHNDGAAYNPASNTWRTIAASPLSPRRHHAVMWTGEEMVVYGGDGQRDGAAYNPQTDAWRQLDDAPFGIGAGELLDRSESHLVVDGHLFVWLAAEDRIARWDASTETWSDVAGTGLKGLTNGALRAGSSVLYAVGTTGHTGVPLLIARADLNAFTGWTRLEDGSFTTARSVVPDADPQWSMALSDGRLLAWSIGLPDAFIELDPTSGYWNDLPPPGHNIDACAGAWGPVQMDHRWLVQSCDTTTIFDPTTDTWTDLGDLAAAFEPRTSVWTGTQLIAWGGTCCYGTAGAPFQPNRAWSYTPHP